MDILVFLAGLTLAVIMKSLAKRAKPLDVMSGFTFIILGLMVLSSPISTISGFTATENVTSASITEITTSIVFQPIDAGLNEFIAVLHLLVGLFFSIMGAYGLWEHT